MSVSAWSIRNPIAAIMLFALLSLSGILCFQASKVQNFPDLDLPTVTVSARLPGASPGQLETDVARKIENQLSTLQGVKHIYTLLQDGSATITVEFRLEKPLQEAVDDVRGAVNQIRAELPSDLLDPVITKFNLSGAPILTYTASAQSMDESDLSWLIDDEVSKRLLTIPGVGAVARIGGVSREVLIEIDAAKMRALGATASDISRQLGRVQRESSGGRMELSGSEQSVRTLSTIGSARELAQIDIPLSDGRKAKLSEIATITDGPAERRSAALLDGKPVVGFEITKSKGASEVEIAALVRRALDKLSAERQGFQFTLAFNLVEQVDENFKGSISLLLEGSLLAIIVVWFFLRDWRATFVAATALPLSVLPTFVGIYFLGFTLNVITLLSLSLVVGILVDDAIVEIENIVRHLRMGKTPYQAAMEAADEIGLAVIATTFTLIAVFLPTAFMSGIPGRFFKQFGWTAAIAVFASLVVARMLTPMMSAYILRPFVGRPQQGQASPSSEASSAGDHDKPSRIGKTYMACARWCLEHRLATVAMSAAFFVGSAVLIPLLPKGFIPPNDYGQTMINIELPPGSKFEDTLALAERARAIIAKDPDVLQSYTAAGAGSSGVDPFSGGGASETRRASITLRLTDRVKRPGLKKQQIEARLRLALADLPGARSKVGLGGPGEKYTIALSGDDPASLTQAAAAAERDLRKIPGIGMVTSSASLLRSEVVVRPDFARAADAGVTAQVMADTLRIATSGDYPQTVSKLNLPKRQIPIVAKLGESFRTDPDALGQLAVPGKGGSPILLANVADISMESGPSQITRYDRARNINIDMELAGLQLGDVVAHARSLPSISQLPAGVRQTEIGDAEVMGELFASFGLAMLAGVLCIYIVLVLLFKDFAQPLTILTALPLSLGGAFVALMMAQAAFSMPSLIGLVMLMGVATKNSILLVDYAIIARREGMDRMSALLDACSKRARPIIMTTIAMGAGMMPIALGLGIADPSFRRPMAIAVIGGLVTSTLLSLLVVPVFYTLVDDAKIWLASFFSRKEPQSPPKDAGPIDNGPHAS